MKPLILSFFMALLVYSLFFDGKSEENETYKFGLEKFQNYEPAKNMQQSQDSLAIYAGMPMDSIKKKNVI